MTIRLATRLALLIPALTVLAPPARPDPIPVHNTFGAERGFMVVRSQGGFVIGHAEFDESAAGDRVTIRLTIHFRDGSLDDETAVLTQQGTIHFVSDHHIQRGPFFKTAIDQTIEANGQVTLRTTGKDGQTKTETSHFDLPPDLSNGIISAMLLNLPQNNPDTTLSMLVPQGKGRLIHLKITPDGTAPCYAVTGDRRTAHLLRIQLELGGVEGVVAPLVGKQPKDIIVWILDGDVPVLIREQAQLAEDSPPISLELAGTSYPRH